MLLSRENALRSLLALNNQTDIHTHVCAAIDIAVK
jgi:hypothetical protein